jgi:hypothetical protein
MEILGMSAGPVRPPLMNCRPADVADIRELMGVYRDVIDESESGVSSGERLAVEAGRISR